MINECNGKERLSISKELEGYKNNTSLHVVNRDGDLFYIECPNCHNTELISRRFFGCKHCMENFSVYCEDGLKYYSINSDFGSLSSGDTIKLIRLKRNDYFCVPLYGRNEKRIEELKKEYPDMEIINLYRDLQNDNKDAHSHCEYKRFTIFHV